MTALAIDIAVLAIVAFCAWRGYKNGLIRGVFGIVALIVSIFVANVAAKAYADEFTGILRPFIGGIVSSALDDMADEGIEYNPRVHDYERDSEDFGTAYTVLRFLGLPEAASVRIAESAVEIPDEDDGDVEPDEEDDPVPVRMLSDLIADRLSSALSYVAVFAIAFVLLAIIFAVIGNLISFVFSLPGLKLLDIIAGSVFGFVKGLILIFALATIVRYFGLLAPELLERTSVLSHIVNSNPVANILGI